MPVVPEISDAEIAYAEGILLPSGKHFDAERQRYIKDWRTIDLQAVPGSGKTTALLAKLVILERHFPLKGSPGVLVISHSNAAVDEIKRRLCKSSPRLFDYPHFNGTIQSFVDAFLAAPYYTMKYGRRPERIDASGYEKLAAEFMQTPMPGFTADEQRRARSFLVRTRCASSYRFHFVENEVRLASDVFGLPLDIRRPGDQHSPGYTNWTTTETARVAAWLTAFKERILKFGVLCYDDAYFLAERAIAEVPRLATLVRLRFPLVFVDEMQDMAPHQCRLLEKLFFSESAPIECFQRIGDRNQAIYNGSGDFDVQTTWANRRETLTLVNSQRLSPQNARVLPPFAFAEDARFEIQGCNTAAIKPHLLVYNDQTSSQLLPFFAQLIARLLANGQIEPTAPRVFTAIAWNTLWEAMADRAGKSRLVDFFPDFKRVRRETATEFDNLTDYLRSFDRRDKSLWSARNAILRAILAGLRVADVREPVSGSLFTIRSFIAYWRPLKSAAYERLELRLFENSRMLVLGQIEEVKGAIAVILPKQLQHFKKAPGSCDSFIAGPASLEAPVSPGRDQSVNLASYDGIDIRVGSVHSVKGHTHTATLYIETSYYNKYESERLAMPLKGTHLDDSAGKIQKQAARMVYVGFSRPTHLLCCAVHEARVGQHLTDLDRNIWEVLKVTDGSGTP